MKLLLGILEKSIVPPQPIYFLAAGDEEYGQTGVRHFVDNVDLPIGRALVGEPTQCTPVIRHKGVVRWDIAITGRSAHTSQAELGRSAIVDAMRVIDFLCEVEADLRRRHTDQEISGPSLTVTKIHGGRACNIVPDRCTLTIDFRPTPEVDGRAIVSRISQRLAELGIDAQHSDFQANAPGLQTPSTHPFVKSVESICSDVIGHEIRSMAASNCSDAGWISTKAPTIVLGPGSIKQAHSADEYVDVSDLVQCASIYQTVMLHDRSIA